jgi:phosphatidylserine/phosphatidylglycerophosphate/cardiolipin synthase-like enzyme
VKRLLWIATADLKDLYVEKKDKSVVPLLQILNDLVKKGVEVRLIHAKEPGTAFREDFDKYPALWGGMERRLCPRVHMKIIVMDSELVYIGSANLTGAGMGMKSSANRNFEAGILTDEPGFIDSAMSHFDSIWEGTHCKKCGRKEFCRDRIK